MGAGAMADRRIVLRQRICRSSRVQKGCDWEFGCRDLAESDPNAKANDPATYQAFGSGASPCRLGRIQSEPRGLGSVDRRPAAPARRTMEPRYECPGPLHRGDARSAELDLGTQRDDRVEDLVTNQQNALVIHHAGHGREGSTGLVVIHDVIEHV